MSVLINLEALSSLQEQHPAREKREENLTAELNHHMVMAQKQKQQPQQAHQKEHSVIFLPPAGRYRNHNSPPPTGESVLNCSIGRRRRSWWKKAAFFYFCFLLVLGMVYLGLMVSVTLRVIPNPVLVVLLTGLCFACFALLVIWIRKKIMDLVVPKMRK